LLSNVKNGTAPPKYSHKGIEHISALQYFYAMEIKLALVDDRAINRQSVREKLGRYTEMGIVLEAVNGNDFLAKLKQQQQLPDVVLMDLEMPELDGIETIKLATAIYPSVKFIVLTVFEDNVKIFEAIKAGAHGYLLKEDTAVNIVDAIVNVYEHNGIPMSPAIARKAMDMMMKAPVHAYIDQEEHMPVKADNAGLSSREMDVLRELASGKNYKFIGEKLFISPQTVRKHVANIYDKLHVNSRTQVINIAHKKKWI
jgi:DNA-binding NarL/FixJ family response regulator